MALDIQTITLEATYTPFERPPDAASLWTAIPRGLVHFTINTAVDAKAATDTALLQLQALIPPGYAYIMSELNVTISQDRAFEWSQVANLNVQNFFRNAIEPFALTGNWTVGMVSSAIDGSQLTMIESANTNRWPTSVFVPVSGSTGIQTNFTLWNPNATNAAAIGVVNYWISFWQFDLEQIRKFPLNTQIPVR